MVHDTLTGRQFILQSDKSFVQVARPANPKGTNLFHGSGQVYNAAERRGEIPNRDSTVAQFTGDQDARKAIA